MSDDAPLEKLERPPIVEAICGVWFTEPVELDPVVLGAYWQRRRDDFPKHAIHPPIEPPGLRFGVRMPTPRTWLLSTDEAIVLQVQPDRFYLNWRARGTQHPRFSDPGALRDRAMSEFLQLGEFCRDELRQVPEPGRIQVGKIDHFAWDGKADLCALMPALRGWLELSSDASPNVVFQLEEENDDASIRVLVGIAMLTEEQALTPVIRMETTATQRVDAGVAGLLSALDRANSRVNGMFKRLIPHAERARRFGVKA